MMTGHTQTHIHLRYSVTLCVVNMMMMNKVNGDNERAPDHNISIIIHFHIEKKFVILKIDLSVDHQNIHPIFLFPSQQINYIYDFKAPMFGRYNIYEKLFNVTRKWFLFWFPEFHGIGPP